MKLQSVSIRFYKSFNHDQKRRLDLLDPNEEIHPEPWEFVIDKFYPHVKVDLDKEITTIVGANESGKSQLLTAIEKARYGHLTEFLITRDDFCRYSNFYDSVDENVPHHPDFGLEFNRLSPNEIEKLKLLFSKHLKIAIEEIDDDFADFTSFRFFRHSEGVIFYIAKKQGGELAKKEKKTAKIQDSVADEVSLQPLSLKQQAEERYFIIEINKLKSEEDFMPPVFRIKSDVPLPGEVPLRLLLGNKLEETVAAYDSLNITDNKYKFLDSFEAFRNLLTDIQSLGGTPEELKLLKEKSEKVEKAMTSNVGVLSEKEKLEAVKGFNLAYDLLYKICHINKEDIKQLKKGIDENNPGLKRANLNKIDKALAGKLRFERIWSQDKNFAINVTATEINLLFSITDRTGSPYSFNERSGGLKHFLSYYIQYLTHQTQPGADSEILLMDEPDAYLSGDAQQDLLKIFRLFANPNMPGADSNRKPVQVVYVTHSPFLIDKNHSERVRAVDKLEGNYGTRVIPGVSQNRYEPLRSAFGSYVGETVFMSQCNLMVEGTADQILLAGFSSFLRSFNGEVPESEILDLNKITIVPCGGADNVAYLTYLALGKGTDKPAVIVMLDSDRQGLGAREQLSKKGDHPDKKAVIADKFILGLGDIKNKEIDPGIEEALGEEKPFTDLEDLVPLELSIKVVKNFLSAFYKLSPELIESITNDVIKLKKSEISAAAPEKGAVSNFKTLQTFVTELPHERKIKIDKVPFAKTLVEMLPLWMEESINDSELRTVLEKFSINMRVVLKRLKEMQIAAEENTRENNQRKYIAQKVDLFMNDFEHQEQIKRDFVSDFIRDIKSILEGSEEEQDFVNEVIGQIRTTHRLTEDPNGYIADKALLFNQLERVRSAKKLVEERKKIGKSKLEVTT